AKLKLNAVANSVTTNNEERDKHLRSTDFFNTDTNNKVVFESTEIEKKGENDYVVEGDLTFNGVTKLVVLEAEYSGVMKDPWGNDRIALVMKGKANRYDWDMTFNSTLESGGVLVGKEVTFDIDS